MNDMSNEPISVGNPTSPLQIWRKALTKPSEQTFLEIASSPNARATTAYLWVFVASLIQIFLTALVQSQLYGNLAEQYGLGADVLGNRNGVASVLTGAICGAPIGAIVTTLFFAIGVFVVQWIAKMFGGRGTSDQLAYAMAAIIAPYSIISGIVTLFSAIPYVGLCFTAVLAIGSIYILVLEVMAVKGVNQISWGAAIGSLLIPGLVIGFICACLVGVSLATLLPLIRESVPNLAP
ncbi:MAG: YIP1 family protein [Chloroflexota bacterium]